MAPEPRTEATMSDPATPGIKIFTGNAHVALVQEIADYLELPLGERTSETFAEG